MPVSQVQPVPLHTVSPSRLVAPGSTLRRLLLAGWLAAGLVSTVWTPPLLAQEPANPAIAAAISVAVLDFDASPKLSERSEAFSGRIRELLAKDTRFQVMERGRMNLGLAAENLFGQPCLETGCAAAAGRALKVDRVVVGELSFIGEETWRATALMVDVKREQTLAAQWISGEMDFEAFLAEKSGVLALRLITGVSSAGTAALPPSVPNGTSLEPADKAPGDKPVPLAPASKKHKTPKRHRSELQRQNPFRFSLTFGEFQFFSLEISDISGAGEDTFNEIVDAIGIGLGFEWLSSGKGTNFSLFTAFHYGTVNEVRLDDDEPDVASGQTVSGVRLPASYRAGGIFSQTEIGVGVNFLLPNWRFQAGLTVFSLLVQYDFQDAILSSGRPTGWEVKGRGLSTTFLFEYISSKKLTLGGIFQSGRVYSFEGSRIDAYEKAGYLLRDVHTDTFGLRIGYGF